MSENATNQSGSLQANAVTADAQAEQRARIRRAFREKYEAMFYIVEFMGSFNLIGMEKQANSMNELKLLLAKARSGLYSDSARKPGPQECILVRNERRTS